jgi:hypothetical protein
MNNETKLGNKSSIALIVAGTLVALSAPVLWIIGLVLISTGVVGRLYPAEEASLEKTFQNGKEILLAHSIKSSSTPLEWYQSPVVWGLTIALGLVIYGVAT